MRQIILTIGLCILSACTSQPTKKLQAATTTTEPAGRVDPRLLEQTDEPAPASAEQRAKDYHQTTKYARGYTRFKHARLLAHGGFSATFTEEPGGRASVTYYFDAHGRYLAQDVWFCDGYANEP